MLDDVQEEIHSLLEIVAAIHQAARVHTGIGEAVSALLEYLACSTFSEEWRVVSDDKPTLSALEEFVTKMRQYANDPTAYCTASKCNDQRLICAALITHLELALSWGSWNQASDPPGQQHLALEMFDSMSQPLVVCDTDLALVHANQAGMEELARGDWLRLIESRIHTDRWIKAFLARNLDQLFDVDGKNRLHCPLHTTHGRRGDLWIRRLLRRYDSPRLLLLSMVAEPSIHALRQTQLGAKADHLDGLQITPRQRDLAGYLLAGLNLTEAANKMGISRATANGHLSGLFKLSRTRRQADLVSWLDRNTRV